MERALIYAAALTYQYVKGRCRVYSIVIAGDAAAGDCQVYDSEGQTLNQVIHLEVGSGGSFLWQSPKGVLFNVGVYIVANAITTKISVEYEPIEPNV